MFVFGLLNNSEKIEYKYKKVSSATQINLYI